MTAISSPISGKLVGETPIRGSDLPGLRVRDLCKTYPTRFGKNRVLDAISFDLYKGERLGILGRNGAGKSTLVRLVSGAEHPTSGLIYRSMSVSWPLAFGGAFHGHLTGVDNIRFISRLYGQDFERNIAFVEDFAELGPYLREEVRTYSSGMRARLAFGISMIIEFDCFLIDEVGAVGDARFHERCNRELFEKRGDRAMIIISHDAGYLRDHCNRFGVLHDSRLTLCTDFDEAYEDFVFKIGLSRSTQRSFDGLPANRLTLIANSHLVAVRDEGFQALVQKADWLRDDQKWSDSEQAYATALRLYPYQRSYWVQKGHCAKEAGAFARAEAAYRTAVALGEPLADVRSHLVFVMRCLGVSETNHPVHRFAKANTPDQVPGVPDLELFAWLCWGNADLADGEVLAFLRTHGRCDSLLAALLADPRCAKAGLAAFGASDLEADGERGEVAFAGVPLLPGAREEDLHALLVAMAWPDCPEARRSELLSRLRQAKNPWTVLHEESGFAGWPEVRSAIGEARSMTKGIRE